KRGIAMESHRLLLRIAAIVFLAATLARGAAGAVIRTGAPTTGATNQLLVRFRPALVAHARATIHGLADAHTGARYRSIPGLELVMIDTGRSIDAALEVYRKRPEVLYAEPNFQVHIDTVPDDPLFGELWGL